MIRSFEQSGGKIIVAIQFDKHAEGLLLAALDLATASGLSVTAVHIVEPWRTPSYMSEAYSRDLGLLEKMHALDQDTKEEAEQRLKHLVEKVDRDHHIETKVLTGYPVKTLCSARILDDAVCIIIGRDDNSYRFVPSILSRTLSIMKKPPLPVLVIKSADRIFAKDKLRILVADDLAENAMTALKMAVSIAHLKPNSEIFHTYVAPRETFKETVGFEALKQELAGLSLPEFIHQGHLLHFQQKLEERFSQAKEQVKGLACLYRAVVRFGTVKEELSFILRTYSPHIAVFGTRQRAMHNPWHTRKLSLPNMLQVPATLLVPEV